MIKIIQRVVLVLTLLAAALMIAAVLKTVGFSDTDGPEITNSLPLSFIFSILPILIFTARRDCLRRQRR
mgnify:CR=1 FL=1